MQWLCITIRAEIPYSEYKTCVYEGYTRLVDRGVAFDGLHLRVDQDVRAHHKQTHKS